MTTMELTMIITKKESQLGRQTKEIMVATWLARNSVNEPGKFDQARVDKAYRQG